MAAKKLTIYTDGASRGNPGHAASAWLILDGVDVLESNSAAIGRATNNVAEYTALISALKAVRKYSLPEETALACFSDSELMISHLNKTYACRSENLLPLYKEVRKLSQAFASVTYLHVPRENGYISACDWLCNQTLDLGSVPAPAPASSPAPVSSSTPAPAPAPAPRADSDIRCTPVGIVRSPFKKMEDAPAMGALTGELSRIEIQEAYAPAITGLHPGDYVYVLCWFDRASRSVLQVHPRGDASRPLAGVFATRSPMRPNPVSLTLARIEKIEGSVLTVSGLEALDATPVLDIKPYSEMDSPKRAS
ncbi:MAG TPA: tRNA (N6-threonylcarbamoyladenosine(37)-N6)-methyltransferase TrmO [Methanocorpusculum sp.]|nr:tRNA (N6-threonylcarbamoyladenosine(37)-N6)-methyltransferase TrmO [Methanocorpusculum sp.]